MRPYRLIRARAPGALDAGDAEELADEEVALADRELGAVERADGRAGGAVALGVVLAAVARAAEAGRLGRRQLDVVAERLLLVVEDGAVRLHRAAEVRAARVEDREARHAFQLAVVADEHRASAHLADLRVLEECGDHELALGKVVERPELDVRLVLVRERRQHHEAEHRQRDHAPDHAAEAERGRGEKHAARVGGALVVALVGTRRGSRERGSSLRLDRRRRGSYGLRDVADPEEPEGEGDHAADDRGDSADDKTGENDGDADRKADRPEARRREVRRLVVVRAQVRYPRH